MKPRGLEIARGGEVLGVAAESEIAELLQIGFLKPNDVFRANDGDSWEPLSKLQGGTSNTVPKLLKRAVPTAKALAATAADATKAVQNFALRRKQDAVGAATTALDAFVPQIKTAIERVAETSTFRAVKSGVQNDDFMRKLFGAAYDCLPKPVQRFVTEERFITFCMARRQKLVGLPPNELPESNQSVPME